MAEELAAKDEEGCEKPTTQAIKCDTAPESQSDSPSESPSEAGETDVDDEDQDEEMDVDLPDGVTQKNRVSKLGIGKKSWTDAEDKILAQIVAENGAQRWSNIASHLPGRMGKQCRERWFNHLCPEVKKGSWTEEEDRVIMESVQRFGTRWSQIVKMMPGRTDNAIKNRYNSAMRRQKRLQRLREAADRGEAEMPKPRARFGTGGTVAVCKKAKRKRDIDEAPSSNDQVKNEDAPSNANSMEAPKEAVKRRPKVGKKLGASPMVESASAVMAQSFHMPFSPPEERVAQFAALWTTGDYGAQREELMEIFMNQTVSLLPSETSDSPPVIVDVIVDDGDVRPKSFPFDLHSALHALDQHASKPYEQATDMAGGTAQDEIRTDLDMQSNMQVAELVAPAGGMGARQLADVQERAVHIAAEEVRPASAHCVGYAEVASDKQRYSTGSLSDMISTSDDTKILDIDEVKHNILASMAKASGSSNIEKRKNSLDGAKEAAYVRHDTPAMCASAQQHSADANDALSPIANLSPLNPMQLSDLLTAF